MTNSLDPFETMDARDMALNWTDLKTEKLFDSVNNSLMNPLEAQKCVKEMQNLKEMII